MGIYSDVLLTVDFDRTLTAPDSSIPERNLEAIRYFIENGGAFTVNTGRSIPMTRLIQEKVPVNAPLLLYNGSAAYDVQEKQLAFVHTIDRDLWETVREIRALFPDLNLEVQGIDCHYNFAPDPMWDAFCERGGCPHSTAREGQDLGPFIKFCVFGTLYDDTVARLYQSTPEEIARFDKAEALLRQKYSQWVDVFRSGHRILDVQVKGVSKGRAARELQQRLGRKILVCVGDAENDITMLEDADFAFVPNDAILKDRFPNVCNCADGAVADVIYEKIPEILK